MMILGDRHIKKDPKKMRTNKPSDEPSPRLFPLKEWGASNMEKKSLELDL